MCVLFFSSVGESEWRSIGCSNRSNIVFAFTFTFTRIWTNVPNYVHQMLWSSYRLVHRALGSCDRRFDRRFNPDFTSFCTCSTVVNANVKVNWCKNNSILAQWQFLFFVFCYFLRTRHRLAWAADIAIGNYSMPDVMKYWMHFDLTNKQFRITGECLLFNAVTKHFWNNKHSEQMNECIWSVCSSVRSAISATMLTMHTYMMPGRLL